MTKSIGITIPTYGRPEKVKQTLQALFQSHTAGIPLPIPVVIVDDGSTPPIEPILREIEIPPAFSLKYIYQPNSGPGAARNTGYQALETDIVLFLDDDVMLLPDSLLRHYEFHLRTADQPCLYYGVCPSIHEKMPEAPGSIVVQEHIASGHLSVPKTLFSEKESPYASNLKTPVAEEYELAYRLHQRHVKIYMDTQNKAIHHIPPPTIDYFIRREYRHGIALAELMYKAPETLNMPPLPILINRHHPYRFRLDAAWLIKSILAHTGLYRWFGQLLGYFTDKQVSPDSIWAKAVIGAAIIRGIKDGLSTFKQS
ncbi:MAG: glycosyltransferase [Bacteroidia bacterium]|nr:glycosyltransferase [Bacteroidia bacterium]